MRVSLENDVRFFWRCASAIRAEKNIGTLMDDDYVNEVELTLTYTEHDKVRARCLGLLDEVQTPALKRTA